MDTASFSCRIVDIDYYTTQPIKDLDVCYSSFRSSPSEKVPVVRIFGATPAGQKTCLHVHGVFPYLYVPCHVTDPSDRYLRQLAVSIDQALQVSLGASSKNAQHVFKITVVEGVPFYGYHGNEELFLKVYLYNPGFVKRLADLLVAGAVMNDVLQPHEAHIPFVLQFMIDYNLYGMNHICLSAVKFRLGEGHPALQPRSSCSDSFSSSPRGSLSQTFWAVNTLPNDMVLTLPRLSTCELEVDCLAQDIVNRLEVSLEAGGYPGLAALWNEERSRRQGRNQAPSVTPPPSPDRTEMPTLLWEEWQWDELNRGLKERFDASSPDQVEVTEGLVGHAPSQSCEVELHHPASLPLPTEGVTSGEELAGDQYVCNEEVVRRSMELSQRLSPNAIRQSTDDEVLALLEELAAIPPSLAPPLPSQTHDLLSYESTAQRLATQLRRSVSSASASQSNGTGCGPARGGTGGPGSSPGGPGSSPGGPGSSPVGPRLSPESGASVAALRSDEELFLSSPPGEFPHFSEAEHKPNARGTSSVDVPQGEFETSALEDVGPSGTYDMSETSFMQFESSQYQAHAVQPSQDRSGPAPMMVVGRKLSRTSSGSGTGLIPQRSGSGTGVIPQSSGSGTGLIPQRSGSGTGLIPQRSGSGTGLIPQRSGSGTGLIPHSSGSGTGLIPQSSGSGTGLIPHSQKKHVLRLCAEGKEGEELEDPLLGGASAGDDEEEEEEEMDNFLMSQPVWDDVDLNRSSQHGLKSEGEEPGLWHVRPAREEEGPPCHKAKSKKSPNLIVQLDGAGSRPSDKDDSQGSSKGKKLSLRRRHSTDDTTSPRVRVREKAKGDLPSAKGDLQEGEPASNIPTPKRHKLSPVAEGGHQLPAWKQAPVSASFHSAGLLCGALVTKALSSSPRVLVKRLSQRELDEHLGRRVRRSPSVPASEPGSIELFSDSSFKSVGLSQRPNGGSPALSWEGPLGTSDLEQEVEVCGENSGRKGRGTQRRKAGVKRRRGRRRRAVGRGRTMQLEEFEDLEEVEDKVLEAKETCSPQQVGPLEELPDPHARPLNIKSSTPQKTSALSLPSEIALIREAEDRDTDCKGGSLPIAERSLGDIKLPQSLGLDVGKEREVIALDVGAALVPVNVSGSGDDTGEDLSYVIPMTPKIIDDIADLEEGAAGTLHHQAGADLPDQEGTSSDNEFHLFYASTSEGDSESCEQVGGEVESPPSPCEGPVTIQRTHVTLMSCCIPGQGPGVSSTASPPCAPGHSSEKAAAFRGLGTCEAIDDVRGSPSPEVKSKYGGGGLAHSTPSQMSSPRGPVGIFEYACLPPSVDELMRTAQGLGLPRAIHTKPFCGNPNDVQPAKEVGNRLLKVRSHMPYDLHEFEPAYVCSTGVRFSSTGLSHWRLILAMVSSHSGEALVPPPCRRVEGEGGGLGTFYSADDHRRDIELRSHFFGNDVVAMVPIQPPPSRSEVLEWYKLRLHEVKMEEKDTARGLGVDHRGGSEMEVSGSSEKEGGHGVGEDEGLCVGGHVDGEEEEGLGDGGKEEGHGDGGKEERLGDGGKEEGHVDGGKEGEHGDGGKEEGHVDGGKEEGHVDGGKEEGLGDGGKEEGHGDGGKEEGLGDGWKEGELGYKTTTALSDRMSGQGGMLSPIREVTAAAVLSVARQQNDTVLCSPDHLVSHAMPLSPLVDENQNQINSDRPNSPSAEVGVAVQRHVSVGGESDLTEMVSEVAEMDLPVEEELVAKNVGAGLGTGGVVPGKCKLGARLRRERPKLLYPPGVKRDTSLLEGPSPDNSFGFKMSESVLGTSDTSEVQHLTTMSIEVHVQTRGKLRPDPSLDPVLAIFYYTHNDWPRADSEVNARHGLLVVDLNNCDLKTIPKSSPLKKGPLASYSGSPAKRSSVKGTPVKMSPAKGSPVKKSPAKVDVDLDSTSKEKNEASNGANSKHRGGQYLDHCGISEQLEVSYANSELDLFQKLVELVRSSDPDLLVGFEVEALSWGYLANRAATLNINLSNELSRVPSSSTWKSGGNGGDAPVKADMKRGKAGLTLHVTGRVIMNIWRIMRHELALSSYTFESLAFHVLHMRVPHFMFQTLTSWYIEPITLSRVVDYYSLRCLGNFQLLEKLNVIGRTSEFARLYGIEFESVLSRGSQYRVESMLLRLAKPSNFIAISPSVQQRARMAAPECLPLILEPESRFYADPVLVLDFQSLYPSMMIAYNYCYSTCLGRVRHLAHHEEFTFGTGTLRVPSSTLKKLWDHVTISPNGVVFVKPHVRKGVVPRMVEEILNTRVMVKQSMKLYKEDKSLLRIMDARQLGLKMIINVTYGYTGATYSGRMPCVEVSDSIVRKARETLEQAINLVNSTPEWRAKVVYGDTDSMFVLLKGASKEEAFRIGKEISDRVTSLNPKPVKLKFEKVYMPCILQTKKRYVGFAYESLEQREPTFDAKGIETVRRDGCPAVAKVLGKSLRLLFATRDVSIVKSYVQGQCSKLLEGRANIQDYTLAREYRGKSSYRPGACVPALELTKQCLEKDPCSEPRVKERVPYVVVYGSPGLPLIRLIRRPEEILEDSSLRLNGVYYITKLILPALNRAFSLIGVDVWQWYADMPRVFRAEVQQNSKKNTIGQYFATMHCVSCGKLTVETMCTKCREEPQVSAVQLLAKMSAAEKDYHSISELCHNCVGDQCPDHSSACTSLDCPILYLINRSNRKRTEARSNADVLCDVFLAHFLDF